MACEHQRNAKTTTQQCPDITSIGVVRMNPIRSMFRLLKMHHKLISEIFEIGPKQFLAEVTLRTEGKTLDAGTGSNRFNGLGVIS